MMETLMNNTEQMRSIITALNESNRTTINPVFATELLRKISPTFKDSDDVNESGLGTTVAFIAVFVGGVEVANVGPLDVSGARQMQQSISQDIEQSYSQNHPYGFTDGSGTVYRMSDWDIDLETCHSSECQDIIQPRMDAIIARSNRY
jgi:hypothetical protein